MTGMVDKMDRFDELPAGDQAFIESMMGYSDPDTNRGNVDPFGINTRSLFGNYAEYVKKRNAMYEASGKTYRPGSWQAQNQQFYQAQENERIRQEKEAAEKQAALIQQVQQQAQINRDRGEGGWGTSLGHEDNVGFMTDIKEMGSFKKGGLATMFERRR
jgi:microsomal dipeptidase-like Zn-dependent dipeptidase